MLFTQCNPALAQIVMGGEDEESWNVATWQMQVTTAFDWHTVRNANSFSVVTIFHGNDLHIDRLGWLGCYNQAYTFYSLFKPTSTAMTSFNSVGWKTGRGDSSTTTGYFDLHFNPSVGTNYMSLNSNSVGVYSLTNSGAGNTYDIGNTNGTNGYAYSVEISGTSAQSFTGQLLITPTIASVAGANYFGSTIRTTSNTVGLEQNGNALTIVSGGSAATNGFYNADLFLLGLNSSGTAALFSNRIVYTYVIGDGSLNMLTLYNDMLNNLSK